MPVQLLYTGKISPRFIFALWHEGEFKTGIIELHIKDLREWANSRLGISIENKTGLIQSCIQYAFNATLKQTVCDNPAESTSL